MGLHQVARCAAGKVGTSPQPGSPSGTSWRASCPRCQVRILACHCNNRQRACCQDALRSRAGRHGCRFTPRYRSPINMAWHSQCQSSVAVVPHPAGEYPSVKDWETHLTTIFPEIRLKRYLEMRGADGGPWANICALPALWVGAVTHGPPSRLRTLVCRCTVVCQHRLLACWCLLRGADCLLPSCTGGPLLRQGRAGRGSGAGVRLDARRHGVHARAGGALQGPARMLQQLSARL